MYNILCLFILSSIEKGKVMIIDISSALKHPGQSFPFSVDGNIDNIDLYGDEIIFKNPVHVNGTIMYTGKNFFVKGALSIEYTTNCALCDKTVKGQIACEFNEEYAQEEDINHPDRYIYLGNNINAEKMIIDNICLNLPLKHLCSIDCKGLCPSCGKNLNDGCCDCETSVGESGFNTETDMNRKENPFAVLENLFNDEDEEAK